MNPAKNMIVHDKRVKGSLTNQFANNIHVLDGTKSLRNTIIWVHDFAVAQNGLEDLYIICHGIPKEETLPNGWYKYTTGYGLRIGDKDILPNPDSIKQLDLWKKAPIKRIILKACGAAYNTWGKKFCNDLAKMTGKTIIASDTIQGYGLRYTPDPSEDTRRMYYNFEAPTPGYKKHDGTRVPAMQKSCEYYIIEDNGWQGGIFEFNGKNDLGVDVTRRENAVGSPANGVLVSPTPIRNDWCEIQ